MFRDGRIFRSKFRIAEKEGHLPSRPGSRWCQRGARDRRTAAPPGRAQPGLVRARTCLPGGTAMRPRDQSPPVNMPHPPGTRSRSPGAAHPRQGPHHANRPGTRPLPSLAAKSRVHEPPRPFPGSCSRLPPSPHCTPWRFWRPLPPQRRHRRCEFVKSDPWCRPVPRQAGQPRNGCTRSDIK
jgi:hypothetical protein